jgi:hypothetical protein
MPHSRAVRSRLLLVVCALALTACRVDANVDIEMAENGSGLVTVTAVADAELLANAPGLAEDLRFDDLVAAGWVVQGPAPTADGGLSLVLRHPFSSPEQATAILATLNGRNGPLLDVTLGRTVAERSVELTMTGFSGTTLGLASFADDELLAAVGATPWAAEVAAQGLTIDQVLSVSVSAALDGEVVATTGTAGDDGRVRWSIPLDGSLIDLATTSNVSLDKGGLWKVLPFVTLAVLVLWVLAAVALIWRMVMARRAPVRRRLR